MPTLDALEMARCAEVNLENLAKQVLGLNRSPFYALVKFQIAECIRELESE
jgi:hypothetical protein